MIKAKILICEENKEEIEQLLDLGQRRAYVQCFNGNDILTLAQEAEAKLETLELSKKYRIGTIVHYSEYATKKNKEWLQDIMEVKLKREVKGWFLIAADKTSRSWEGRINRLIITDEAINQIVNKLRYLALES